MPADCMAADDGRVCSERCSFFNHCRYIESGPDLRVFPARYGDVREDHGRPAEYVILESHAFINGDVVLDFDEVADLDVVSDIDVLTEDAFPADAGAALDVGEVPDLGAFADFDIVVNVGTLVNEIGLVGQEVYSFVGMLRASGCRSPREGSGTAWRRQWTISTARRFSSSLNPRPARISS